MAVIVITSQPKKLIEAIKSEINDSRIDTWSVDKDGDFQHNTKSQQWKSAWMRPKTIGVLMIELVPIFTKTYKASAMDYGVLQGRFVEMLIGHFSELIDNVIVTLCGRR